MSKRTLHIYFSGTSSTSTPSTNDNINQSIWRRVEFSQSDVIDDPGNHIPIEEYPPEIRDQVRRAYAFYDALSIVHHSYHVKGLKLLYLSFVWDIIE